MKDGTLQGEAVTVDQAVKRARADLQKYGHQSWRGHHIAIPRADLEVLVSAAAAPTPLPVVLYCPRCKEIHVDAPEPDTGWRNPPHKTHRCHYCELLFRPSDYPTMGIDPREVKTRGDAWT